MSITKIISIASWVIEKYESIKATFKRWHRGYISRKIRKAVDTGNINYITKLVQSIKKKRQNRRDSA